MSFNTILFTTVAVTAAMLLLFTLQGEKQPDKNLFKDFLDYNRRFNKKHASKEEMLFRFNNFARNKKLIAEANSKQLSYTLGETPFSDMTFEEFSSLYLLKEPILQKASSLSSVDLFVADGDKDWRKDGKVTPVRDAGKYGEGWAISSTDSIESAIAIKTGTLNKLSANEVQACASQTYYKNLGGGFLFTGFKYVQGNQVNLDKDYPFDVNTCKPNFSKPRFGITDYKSIDPPDVNGLIQTIDKLPVSVGIEVRDDFMLYTSGVYSNDDATCGQQLNHAITAVGYSVRNGDGYFILKNSWGEDWGEKGYVRVKIGTDNGTCGIASENDLYAVV